MSLRLAALSTAAILVATPLAGSTGEALNDGSGNIWGRICSFSGNGLSVSSWARSRNTPVAKCPPPPTGYQTLPSIGTGGDTSVAFNIGYDPDTQRLCFTTNNLPQAPVLRVGVGNTLSVQIANTLHDTGKPPVTNCPIETYGGEGLCLPEPVFPEAPGPDGGFYPLMANEAHAADGTSNLHVHGLFVPPVACSDEVLASTIYPAVWGGRLAPMPPCQPAPNMLDYAYQLPPDHPAGAYWYHTHRHGEAEHETQMGLVGAIVVEDAGDAWRQSIGVSDEVLLVTDEPNPACLVGPSCDLKIGAQPFTRRQPDGPKARAAARASFQAAPARIRGSTRSIRLANVPMAPAAISAVSSSGHYSSTAPRCPKRRMDFPPTTSC
jgi:hypothetical protein